MPDVLSALAVPASELRPARLSEPNSTADMSDSSTSAIMSSIIVNPRAARRLPRVNAVLIAMPSLQYLLRELDRRQRQRALALDRGRKSNVGGDAQQAGAQQFRSALGVGAGVGRRIGGDARLPLDVACAVDALLAWFP